MTAPSTSGSILGHARPTSNGCPRSAAKHGTQGSAGRCRPDLRRPGRVLVLGMGGSAIGAEVVTTVAARTSRHPHAGRPRHTTRRPPTSTRLWSPRRGRGRPRKHWSRSSARWAGRRMRLAITSGGRLGRLGAELGYNVFSYEFAGQPRAAYRLGRVLAAGDPPAPGCDSHHHLHGGGGMHRIGSLCASDWGIDVPVERNAAKQIAQRLHGRIPVVLGAGRARGRCPALGRAAG